MTGTVEAPKEAVRDGALPTLSVPLEADVPVPPFVDERLPVDTDRLPACEAVTLTETVQVLPGVEIAPAERLMELLPATAAGVPPQVFESPGVEATVRPVGRAAVNAIPVRPTELAAGLVMLKLSVLLAPTATEAGLNAAELVGGATT